VTVGYRLILPSAGTAGRGRLMAGEKRHGQIVHEPILAGNDNAGATVSRDPRARLTV